MKQRTIKQGDFYITYIGKPFNVSGYSKNREESVKMFQENWDTYLEDKGLPIKNFRKYIKIKRI